MSAAVAAAQEIMQWAKQDNEVTRDVKQRLAAGETYEQIMKDLVNKAKQIPDKKERNERLRKIDQARKFLGEKNRSKREENR